MAPSIMETEPVAQVSLKQIEVATPVKVTTPAKDSTHEEYQYLDLIREILDNGEHRPDRQSLPFPSPTNII
jgi:thymidylate synthase